MNFDEYQQNAGKTAVYPFRGSSLALTPPEEWASFARNHEGEDGRIPDDELVRLFAACQAEQRGIVYAVLGLVGEAGECAEALKKFLRGDTKPDEAKEKLRAELGDVMWYAAEITTGLKTTLGEIAEFNLSKLADRKARGVIKGSGDNR